MGNKNQQNGQAQKSAEQKAVEEKAEAERKAAEEKAQQEQLEREEAEAERKVQEKKVANQKKADSYELKPGEKAVLAKVNMQIDVSDCLVKDKVCVIKESSYQRLAKDRRQASGRKCLFEDVK